MEPTSIHHLGSPQVYCPKKAPLSSSRNPIQCKHASIVPSRVDLPPSYPQKSVQEAGKSKGTCGATFGKPDLRKVGGFFRYLVGVF